MLPATPVFEQVKSTVRGGDLAQSPHVWALAIEYILPLSTSRRDGAGRRIDCPPLISQDIRSRAFLLYFSRPLTRMEYLVGKTASLWAYLAMITAVPALSLYAIGVVLSPNLSVVSPRGICPFEL